MDWQQQNRTIFRWLIQDPNIKKTKQLHAARYTDKTRSFLGTAGIIAAIFVGKKKYCTNCEHVLAAFVAMKLKPKRDLCGFCAKT